MQHEEDLEDEHNNVYPVSEEDSSLELEDDRNLGKFYYYYNHNYLSVL